MSDSGPHDDEHARDGGSSLPGILGRTAKAKSKEVVGELTNKRDLQQEARGEYDESIEEIQDYEDEHGAPRGQIGRSGFDNQPPPRP